MKVTIIERVEAWSGTRGITQQKPDRNGYVTNKVEELGEYAEAMKKNDVNGIIDAIADSMIFDMTELLKMGMDIELVLEEVLCVIESRTGAWSEKDKKFIKNDSPEAKLRWHIPNYIENCKAKNPKSYIGDLFEESSC